MCRKLIHFDFQMFPLFVPETSTTFTWHLVQIISIYFGSDPVIIAIWLVSCELIVLNIIRRTMT